MRISSKKWTVSFVIVTLIFLMGAGAIIAIIDPYFHYHKPLSRFQYKIKNQRYINDGIVKHFDYDAIITGTSMTENFKASEFDQIFGMNSVKVPFSGGSYEEINDNLLVAASHNSNIKIILRCLDYDRLLDPPNIMDTDEKESPRPRYLYDDYFYNDVEYIFNKTVLFDEAYGNVVKYTRDGGQTTDFDTYSNWMERFPFGKEVVDAGYSRPEKKEEIVSITDEDYKNMTENITQNVTNLANEYPEIEFYLFFPPYSIYYWDALYQAGAMERQLDAEKYVIELLLKCENIHLFSFYTEYEMICDLDNYKDTQHYIEDINSRMLVWMSEGTHELTKENYEVYCNQMREFYMNYNYDALFE